jgi:TolA-binding protein
MLLITVVGYHTLAHRPGVAVSPGSGAPGKSENPASAAVSQLADLTLPAFAGSSLRGAGEDKSYTAGMKAYASGDCATAVVQLARVPAQNADAPSAQFYSGVCQMKLNQLDTAATTLGRVASRGDSPQQEAALYYLAQIALLRDDAAAARQKLDRVISLHGDFEQRATGELKKLPAASPENK